MSELPTYLKHTAELALIRAIPDMILGDCKQGRLQRLNQTLITQVDTILSTMPRVGYVDMERISHKIFEFARDTGWERKQKHVATFASFALEMIEQPPFAYPEKITYAWMCTPRENKRRLIGAFISDGPENYFPDWMWEELFELFTIE